jgi:choline-sulfatase
MSTFRSLWSLAPATLVAGGMGWAASCLLLAFHSESLSQTPSLGSWVQVVLASWLVPFAFAGVCALWLALALVLEAQLAEPLRERPRRFVTQLALLSWLLLGLPGYALVWVLTAKTTAWKSGVSEWQVGLLMLLLAPFVRLLLGLVSKGFRRVRRGREPLLAAGLLLLALVALASWALLTASLGERYGASQLIGYGLVVAVMVLGAFAWFEPRAARAPRTELAGLLALGVCGVGALLSTPSSEALELFHHERPTRWFARVLGTTLPDGDGDGAPRNLGLLRGGDCDDEDADRSPFAFDAPQNGLDENCFAGDALSSLQASFPLAPVAARSARAERAPWNVIVLALDSVRFDARYADGIEPALMPELSKLAASSFAFRDFRTCAPRTRESVPDLLGARPGANEPNAVQALADRGVHTVFIASDWLARHAAVSGFTERKEPKARYGAFADGEVLAELEGFLAGAPAEPFFLFSHWLGAHEPYAVGAGCARDTGSAYGRYQCALQELDRKLGVLLAALRNSGLAERSVIAVTADHGEEFREHGGRYHATTLYDEVLHVPLVIHAPGAPASLVSTALSCLDFLPTLLGAAHFSPNIAARGRDRLDPEHQAASAQFARTRPAHESALFEPKQNAVIHAGYKLIWDRSTGLAVYFDLARDPREARPLARAPAVVESRLLAYMDAWLSDQAPQRHSAARLSLSLPP